MSLIVEPWRMCTDSLFSLSFSFVFENILGKKVNNNRNLDDSWYLKMEK